jgi:hypothetical protein
MPTIPSLPASGSTSWYSHYTALDTTARRPLGGIMVRLSDFSGASDDAKLTAAMAYCAAQTYRGITILLDESKTYSFSTKQPLYTGFSIMGSFQPHDQDRSGNPTTQEINLGTTGGWFYLNQSQTFSCSFVGLTLNGGSGQRLLDGHASNVLWTSNFRDITAVNLGNVLGSVSTKLLNTAICLDGFWNVNNIQERAWVLGGSDSRLSFSMALIDSPGDAGQFAGATSLLEYSSQAKTPTRNLYITAEGNHSGIYIGSGSSEHLTFTDCTIEGRNAGSPSDGRLVRVQGTNSRVTFRDCWLAYAMANPGTHTGVVQVDGGSVLLDGCTYERATGVAETVPLLAATAGHQIVKNIRTLGSWTGKPRVRITGTATVDADDSVTVVTV